MKLEPCVIIDTREQNPLIFANLPTIVGTLDTGDYSVSGLTRLITVERKSLNDLLACCGRERERFKRELRRLRAYRFRLLIIETDAQTLEAGGALWYEVLPPVEGAETAYSAPKLKPWRSELKPAHVLGALAAWTAQYELPVWLAGTHEAAGRFVERFLYQCARVIQDENTAAGSFETIATKGADPLEPPTLVAASVVLMRQSGGALWL